MPNYKEYNQQQNILLAFDSDKFIAEDSIARHINYVFEEEISIAKFESKINNDTEKGGASCFNIRMILKTIFYAYTQCNYSSREIEAKCLTDIYYIYLTGYRQIDHSTICRFINKYAEEIQDVFSQIVYIMESAGYIDKKIVAIDGTKIKASANKKFCGTIEEYQEKKTHLQERIKYLISLHKSRDRKEQRNKTEKKIKQCKEWQNKISEFMEKINKTEKSEAEKKLEGKAPRPERYNLTDEDCRIMRNEGNGIFTGYNAQTAVDDKNDLIIQTEVYNRASDRVLAEDFTEKVELKEDTKTIMDAGFHSIEALIYFDKKGIDAYVPEGRDDSRQKEKKAKYKGIGTEQCEKIKGENKVAIKCPGGQEMQCRYIKKDRREYRYVFHPDKSKCHGCKEFEKCQGHIKKGSRKKLEISKMIFDNLEIINNMKAKLQSAAGREIYNKRIGIVEHPFGEIKEHKKFQRFNYRGLAKVNTQWKIVCAAYNLRKWNKLKTAG